MMKRFVAILLTVAMLTILPLPVFAVSDPYSLSVTGRTVSFLQNGEVTSSFTARSSDLALTADRSGTLLQFTNMQGKTTAIALGDQKELTIQGTVESFTISSMVGSRIKLITDSESNIKNLLIYAPMEAIINGTVGTLTQQGASIVTVSKTGKVTTARQIHRQATLTAMGEVKTVEKVTDASADGAGIGKITTLSNTAANVGSVRSRSGLVLDNSNSRNDDDWYDDRYDDWYDDRYDNTSSSKKITTTTGNSLRLEAKTIYADDGDELSDLTNDLEDAVRAYTRSGGKRVYGDVYWVDEDDEVDGTGYYSYYFDPDNNYSRLKGRIRIISDDDDDSSSGSKRNVYLEIDSIRVTGEDDLQLRDILSDLEGAVTAYESRDGDVLEGTLKWSSPSKRVRDTDYYNFTFTPDSSRYKKKTGRIRVYVD